MNLIKGEIESLISDITWDNFVLENDEYVTNYIPPGNDNVDAYSRLLHLRGKYPSDYAAALNSKLPEDAIFVSYDHLSLKLTVTRA